MGLLECELNMAEEKFTIKNITTYKKQDYMYDVTIFDRFPSEYKHIPICDDRLDNVRWSQYYQICNMYPRFGDFPQHFGFEPYGVFLKFPLHPSIWLSNTF